MLPRELLYIIADLVHFDALLNSLIAFNLMHDIDRFLDKRIIKTITYDKTYYALPNGAMHRKDLPAIEYTCGSKEWYWHGKLHRENDLPAREWSRNRVWYLHNWHFRDRNLPAIKQLSDSKEWYWHGKLHRDNDLPAIEHLNGDKEWYWHGKRHRENDLPAIERSSGIKEWFWHGIRCHVDDLHAILTSNGDKEWYQFGERVK